MNASNQFSADISNVLTRPKSASPLENSHAADKSKNKDSAADFKSDMKKIEKDYSSEGHENKNTMVDEEKHQPVNETTKESNGLENSDEPARYSPLEKDTKPQLDNEIIEEEYVDFPLYAVIEGEGVNVSSEINVDLNVADPDALREAYSADILPQVAALASALVQEKAAKSGEMASLADKPAVIPMLQSSSQGTPVLAEASELSLLRNGASTNGVITSPLVNLDLKSSLEQKSILSSITEKIAASPTTIATVDVDQSVLPVPSQALKTSSSETQAATQLSITTPFNKQATWGEAVSERVMWMSSKGIREASIQLDPPELGPLSVKVSVTQEQAQVSFTVQNASVREALDQSSQRLREMFAEEGLNLADVDVSDQSQSEEHSSDESSNSSKESLGDAEISETPIRSSNTNYHIIDSYV